MRNVVYIRKVKKSESKSQPYQSRYMEYKQLCISRKFKWKQITTSTGIYPDVDLLCISRKVKKSESKSQPTGDTPVVYNCCVYP